MNTITCKATVGSRCKDQEQLLPVIDELISLASGFDVSDLFPSIKILHRVTGMRNRLWRLRTKTDVILDDVISDHQQRRAGGQNTEENEDLLDVLLRLKDDGGLEIPLTLDNIKAVILVRPLNDNDWQEVNRKNRRSVFDRLKPSLSQKSNVDDLAKISLSVYVSNFLSHLTIGKLRLHANVARFHRNMVATTPRAGVNGNIKADIPDRSYNTKANSYAFVAKTPYVDNMKGSYSVREDSGDHNLKIDLSRDGAIDFPFVVLGCYKDFCSIANSRTLCRSEGFLEVDIKYLGGLWTLFDFHSLGARDKFLIHSGIQTWFSSLKLWHDDFQERLVWLEVEGVPIHAWDNAVFRSICNKWGDMLFSDDSDTSNRLSKRLCIKSKHSQLIFATIFVTVRKISYVIRVRELCSWTPSFTGDDSDCDDENYMDTHAQVDKSATEKNVDVPFGDILADNGEEFFNANVVNADDVNSDKEDADPQVGVHGDDAHDSDPFGLEPLINMKASKVVHESACSETPVFPPGFSPQCIDDHSSVKDHPPGFSTKMQQDHAPVVRSLNDSLASDSNSLGGSHKSVGFSLVERLEEMIKVGLALGLNMEGCECTLAALIANNGDLKVDK
ncbi:reverse transcriptase domain, reverse transcriptase zinc-binding domain protein [Tanacetum coccineum]